MSRGKLCIDVCVCIYVCLYICICTCTCMYSDGWLCAAARCAYTCVYVFICAHIYVYVHVYVCILMDGNESRLMCMGWLWLVGLIKYRSLLQKSPIKRQYSAQETYNFIDPTDRSHPISAYFAAARCAAVCMCMCVFCIYIVYYIYIHTNIHTYTWMVMSCGKVCKMHIHICVYVCVKI